MASLTRGPLPARVYWVRRAAVLATVLLLVVGLARLVGGGGEPTGDGSLTTVLSSAEPSEQPTTDPAEPAAGPEKPKKKNKKKNKKDKPKEPVLAQPTGDCVDSDVAITPAVDEAVAGRPVLLVLELRTALSPACTWRVSPETLTVKITSGADDIWFSRQCPRSIPTQDVVVRREATTKVGIRWSGRRSDLDCSRFTDWAMPGYYHVSASALAGEPSDVQFRMVRPDPEVILQEEEPEKDRDRGKTKPRDRHVSGPGQR